MRTLPHPDHRRVAGTPDEKLAWSVDEAAQIFGIGRSAIYEEIRSGRLRARKVGARTIILKEDGLAFLRSLPAVRTRSPEAS
jgi:excisionase family DNA binding protein